MRSALVLDEFLVLGSGLQLQTRVFHAEELAMLTEPPDRTKKRKMCRIKACARASQKQPNHE
jgi:hypothetical protein